MRSIVCVNIDVPTIDQHLHYDSQDSLRDYDIVIFCQKMPYYERIQFTGGGSCISIEGTEQFQKAASHWSRELAGALAAGKTVFVVLSAVEQNSAAQGSSMGARNTRNYSTTIVDNYSAIPTRLAVRNSRGSVIIAKDSSFKSLLKTIESISEYRVVFDDPENIRATFAARDGTVIGGVARLKSVTGSLVLLPYFDFQSKELTEYRKGTGDKVWNQKALSTSHAFTGQIIAIDQALRGEIAQTPPPEWMSGIQQPKAISEIEGLIFEFDSKIEALVQSRENEVGRKLDLLRYTHLLFENGKSLEQAVEKVLGLMGYSVETLRIGDLEIDHVIVGPSGLRMIGESEGKDSSAIDITKFRQLESNIGEDFEREGVSQPAKGLIFGNGFRLLSPDSRPDNLLKRL